MHTSHLLRKLVVCCAVDFMVTTSYAQPSPPTEKVPMAVRTLTAEQMDSIVRLDLEKCSPQASRLKSGRLDPASIIPTSMARGFPNNRVAKTLHGMWRGRVLGDDKDVRVDYFWIFDMKRNESLILAQRTGKDSLAGLNPIANAPKFSYLMCAHEGYFPSKETPQIQEFVKVSNDIKDAPKILTAATGLKHRKRTPTLSDMWKGLVSSGYFKSLPSTVAFAGGFFKPHVQRVASEVGPALTSLKWDAEYYGGGPTAVQFTPGVPIKGVEYAQFVGASTNGGDFLVASPGNGKLWKVETMSSPRAPRMQVGSGYELGFDAVVFGPLQQ